MEYARHYSSPLGSMIMTSDGTALTGLWFDGQKYFGSDKDNGHEDASLSVFEETAKWLDIYFSGREPDFTPTLAACGTDFRRAVWDILLTIPYGQTMTYGEIAGIIAGKKKSPACRHRRSAGRWVTIPSLSSSRATGSLAPEGI